MPGRSKKDKSLSIAEEVGDDDDITSWVQKSRKLEQKKKKEEEKQARARAQAFDELDNEDAGDFEKAAARSFYLPKDIAGMKVTHDLKEIEAGDNVILTLKDQAILDENYEENEEDALENVHLTEQQRLAEIKRLKQKKTKYDVYDMDKKQDILPQYDEDDGGPAFVLPSVRDAATKKQQEQVRAKLQAMKSRLKKHDASGPAGSSISDFRSEEEEAALSFKKKPKKKRKIRSRGVEESGGSLVDILESQAAASRNGGIQTEDKDHGSRRRNVAKEEKERKEEEDKAKRDAGYAFARIKAKEKSQNEYGSTLDVGEAAMDVMETYTGDAMDELEQEEDQLYNSLARSRKGSVKKVDAAEIRRRAQKVKEEEGEGPVGGMVFSETTEFCRLVSKEDKSSTSSQRVKKEEKVKEEQEKEEEKEEKIEKEEEPEAQTQDDDVEMEVKQEEEEEREEEEEEEEGAADLVEKQALVGRGLAATLAFMKSTSVSSETMYIGRQGDKSAEYLAPNDDDHIRIEHRDEYGRMITPKEAFRAMSHKFHGKPPGKNKQEKRLKRYLEDQRKNHMSATDTPLNTVSALKKAQKKSGSAFVVIDGSGGHSAHSGGSQTPVTKGFRGAQTPSQGFASVDNKKEESSGGQWVKIETGVKRKREDEEES